MIVIKHERLIKVELLIFFVTVVMLLGSMYYYYNTFDGSYSPITGNITIYGKNYEGWYLHETSQHEVGHDIFFTELTHEDRIKYKEIYEDSNKYLSSYARTGYTEDFAEEYAHMVECKYTFDLITSEEKKEFFKETFKQRDVTLGSTFGWFYFTDSN